MENRLIEVEKEIGILRTQMKYMNDKQLEIERDIKLIYPLMEQMATISTELTYTTKELKEVTKSVKSMEKDGYDRYKYVVMAVCGAILGGVGKLIWEVVSVGN